MTPLRSSARHLTAALAAALLALVPLASPALGGRDRALAQTVGQPATQTATRTRAVPGPSWATIADPAELGFCADRLARATETAKSMPTTGAVAIVDGRVLWQYGDLETVSYLASVRKSILAMMYGKYVANGKIRLDATMEELKIGDIEGLLPLEKTATVADLLAARSGVYHEAANAACTGCGSTAGDPPGPRGTVKPGTYFLYNNWDFNALGTIFEQQTGLDIYDAFEQDLARPMQFEDFDRAAQRKSRNPRRSQHEAYHFNLSTRDMARIGLLMLREGDWGGTRLMDAAWARRIIQVVTPVHEMNPESMRQGPFGYSFLWWIWDGPFNQGPYRGAYTGIGAIGQFITVLPAMDMVVAHKTRPGGESVSRPQYLALLDRLTESRCGG